MACAAPPAAQPRLQQTCEGRRDGLQTPCTPLPTKTNRARSSSKYGTSTRKRRRNRKQMGHHDAVDQRSYQPAAEHAWLSSRCSAGASRGQCMEVQWRWGQAGNKTAGRTNVAPSRGRAHRGRHPPLSHSKHAASEAAATLHTHHRHPLRKPNEGETSRPTVDAASERRAQRRCAARRQLRSGLAATQWARAPRQHVKLAPSNPHYGTWKPSQRFQTQKHTAHYTNTQMHTHTHSIHQRTGPKQEGTAGSMSANA